MRAFILAVIQLIVILDAYSQEITKSVYIQDFNNVLIREVVLKIHPSDSNKRYLGYTLLVFISQDEKVKVSKLESSFGIDIQPIDEKMQENFTKNLANIDLTMFKGCLLVYPILVKMHRSLKLEDNLEEGIKSMVPLVKFEGIDCAQFQEPLIVSGRRGS
ncbi:hypothetical protein [Algoriphagus hitonicola]|uniref:Uncharacterized protein n=1 Tax=Algoriphagus hitonicola TaxID=435880 RepID=A0A1I2NG71_9BACT|nr:hypothetical protein [Algoriphagus hitonicola]SFG00687.1 hypothetical protein SAMN04487988_1016 [Algoriphagus hitonicola]